MLRRRQEFLPAGEAAPHQHKEQRHKVNRQQGGGNHPAHHFGADHTGKPFMTGLIPIL